MGVFNAPGGMVNANRLLLKIGVGLLTAGGGPSKGLKTNINEGKELSPLWIRTIAKAQEKPPYEPHPHPPGEIFSSCT